MNTIEFANYLRKLDIKLFLEGDRLRCNAPKGTLTPALKAEISDRKAEIISFLQQANLQTNTTAIIPISRTENNTFPLSFTQEGLWFLYQLQPNSPFYNIPLNLHLSGQLNIAALEWSLQLLIDRHEILRTNFINVDGKPAQVINATRDFSLPIVDLRSLSASERDLEYQKLVSIAVSYVFNLTEDPLLWVQLVQLTPTENVLLLTIHHIIFDGWSVNILLQELTTIYSALVEQSQPNLPQINLHYVDYAVWQQQWLKGEILESQLAYWQQKLALMPELLELPTDRPRPAVQSFRGETQFFTIEPDISEALVNLSQQHGVTLFMLLLTAFKILLYRYTNQPDIVVGSTVANRQNPQTQGMIGFFVNTLVLRTNLSNNPTFLDLLQLVKQVVLEAYDHQELPFDKLVEALHPERNLSYSPLFQIDFSLEHESEPVINLKDLTINISEPVGNHTAKFDLSLSLLKTGQGLTGGFEYSTDLSDATTIARMIEHWQTLLAGIVANPKQRLSDLPILTTSEQHKLFVEWNDTAKEYPQDKCIHQLFEEQVERSPDSVAVVFEDQQLTYQELNQRANQLAHYLKGLGVRPEVLVGICVERSVEMVVGLLGILKAGGAYVPLDPSYPAERLSYMLVDAGVGVLLTQTQWMESLTPHQAKIVCFDSAEEVINTQTQENATTSGVSPTNLAYIIYTSGSTGKPKGVMIEHRSVINLANWQRDQFEVTEQSSIAQFFSYSFDGAVGETFMALLNGATLFMLDRTNWSPETIIESINSRKITNIVLVPSLIKELNLESIKESAIFSIVSVGEKCPVWLAQQWAKKKNFMNAYGPTEYTVYSHLYQAKQSQPEVVNILPIGKAIHNTKTYILDASLNPVPIGFVGEIYISGLGIARGYLNQGQKTLEKFIPNKFYLADKFSEQGLVKIETSLQDIFHLRNQFKSEDTESKSNQVVLTEISVKEILNFIKELDTDLIKTTLNFLEKYQNNYIVYSSFCRYLLEGYYKIYQSCGINQDVLRFLFQEQQLYGLKVIDFGFGNGEVIQSLAEAGSQIIGLDINPFFVYQSRKQGLDARMAKIDIEPTKFVEESGIAESSQDFAISTLTLDRVSNPKNLLENIFNTLKPGGRFAIQTLLPIITIEDGEIENPLVYTDEHNQITPGKSVEEDKLYFIALLYELGARDLNICQIPYVVKSRDGIQDYIVWCFFGNKTINKRTDLANNYYARMYKTGDLARYLPDGNIEFIDRIDHQVKIRGFRIELGEIEAILSQHPSIRETAVIASENIAGDKQLVAYVVPHQQSAPSINDLRRFLKEYLPDYMIPNAFVLLEALPLTPNGKVNRRALPALDSDGWELEDKFVAPRSPTEEMIAAIWAEVLGLKKVGINDNFFELGGHSLQAISLVSKLSVKMNLKVLLKLLFEHPTIAELAEALNQLPSQTLSFKQEETQTKVEKPVTTSLTPTKDLSPFLKLENRSLLSLFAVGKIASVDSAALGYLPLSLLKETNLTRDEILQDWLDNLPMWDAVMKTKWGRIAGLTLPIFEDELYSDPQKLIQMTIEALEMAGRLGAKTVSLTGLIPSATDYGRAIVKAVEGRRDLPKITTGHAITCSSVVLTIKKTLQVSQRSLEQEKVAFIGLGSVGINSLRLMLKCLPHPAEIILCDVYSKLESIQKIQREINGDLGFRGSIQIATSSSFSELPSEIYDATLIIGATNVPDLLDIERVKSGTLIVDDSGPHCFSPEQAIKRFEEQKDILFTEGGVLQAPEPIETILYLPELIKNNLNETLWKEYVPTNSVNITGCVLSGLLSSRFDHLEPTVGLLNVETCVQHYQSLEQLGFQAADLHCEGYVLQVEPK